MECPFHIQKIFSYLFAATRLEMHDVGFVDLDFRFAFASYPFRVFH